MSRLLEPTTPPLPTPSKHTHRSFLCFSSSSFRDVTHAPNLSSSQFSTVKGELLFVLTISPHFFLSFLFFFNVSVLQKLFDSERLCGHTRELFLLRGSGVPTFFFFAPLIVVFIVAVYRVDYFFARLLPESVVEDLPRMAACVARWSLTHAGEL